MAYRLNTYNNTLMSVSFFNLRDSILLILSALRRNFPHLTSGFFLFPILIYHFFHFFPLLLQNWYYLIYFLLHGCFGAFSLLLSFLHWVTCFLQNFPKDDDLAHYQSFFLFFVYLYYLLGNYHDLHPESSLVFFQQFCYLFTRLW